jgi:hypothetical protein
MDLILSEARSAEGLSALALFVPRVVLADHPDNAVASDDLAVHAALLYRGTNFHGVFSWLARGRT